MTDADLEVSVRIMAHGMETFRDMRDALAELAIQATVTNLILRSTAMGDIGDGGDGGGGGRGGGGGGGGGLMGFLRAMPGQTWIAVLIASLLVLGIVFEPVTALIVSATVAVTSFTLGLAALITVVGLAAGGFALLGAGVLALGIDYMGGTGAADALTKAHAKLASATESVDGAQRSLHLAQLAYEKSPTEANLIRLQGAHDRLGDALEKVKVAQENYNTAVTVSKGPLATLMADLDHMVEVLGKQAAPLASAIILWVDKAIPGLTGLGGVVLHWFGDRLPGALRAISTIISDLLPDFIGFGEFLGKTFDHIFGSKDLKGLFEAFVRYGISQVEGLITNLVRLSDWFKQELPTLRPIVEAVFSWLGTQLQGLATNWAKLTDWVKTNWPATVKDAKENLDNWGKALDNLSSILNSQQTKDGIKGWIDIGIAINGAANAIEWLVQAITDVVPWLPFIPNVVNAVHNIPGGASRTPGGHTIGGNAVGGMVPGSGPQWVLAHGGERILRTDQQGGMGDSAEILAVLTAILQVLQSDPHGQTGVAAALYKAMMGANISRTRGFAGGLL